MPVTHMLFVIENKGSYFSQTNERKRDKNPLIPFRFSELKKLIIEEHISLFNCLLIQIFRDLV